MINTILIVGAGTMGSGIAQSCAQYGLLTSLTDTSADALARARASISHSLRRLADKDQLREPPETIAARIHFLDGLQTAAPPDLAIEAVTENFEIKATVFAHLDRLCPPHALLASNTSAIPISRISTCTARPDKVVGLHFFNPVPLMQAVEVVRAAATSDATFEAAVSFVRVLGKEPIAVQRDVPGFLINRINLPSTLEAMRLVEQGVGSVQDIDKGMRLALGRRMGIFETGDLVGLDVTLGALTAMHEETGDARWAPPEILRDKVAAGHLGRKTGRGWYDYDADGKRK